MTLTTTYIIGELISITTRYFDFKVSKGQFIGEGIKKIMDGLNNKMNDIQDRDMYGRTMGFEIKDRKITVYIPRVEEAAIIEKLYKPAAYYPKNKIKYTKLDINAPDNCEFYVDNKCRLIMITLKDQEGIDSVKLIEKFLGGQNIRKRLGIKDRLVIRFGEAAFSFVERYINLSM